MNTQKLQILTTLAILSFVPFGSAESPGEGTPELLGTVAITVDTETGTWSLQSSDDLVCTVPEVEAAYIGDQPLSLSVACVSDLLESVDGRTCWGVGAEAETNGAAEADVTTTCGSLSVSCDAESDNGGYDYCYDEEWGQSNPPMNCEADLYAAWWDYGSYARATCYFWYTDSA